MTKLRTFLPVYRSERGMTQEELANRVGVRRETISRLEKGQYNPSLKLAMDIAAVFSLPVESLFFFYEDVYKRQEYLYPVAFLPYIAFLYSVVKVHCRTGAA